MKDLEKKNIIITGASGGIGNSIVEKLNECGANILASGTKIEKLEESANTGLIRWQVKSTNKIFRRMFISAPLYILIS